MEEQKPIVEGQVEEQKEQPAPAQEVKPEEFSQEKMESIKKDIEEVLNKHKATLEVMPTYNLMIKPRK